MSSTRWPRTSVPTAAAGSPPSTPRWRAWARKPPRSGPATETYADAAAELGLRAPEDKVLFGTNRDRLAAVEAELAQRHNELQEQRTELTMKRTVLTEAAADLKAELTSLQSRRNLLPLQQLEIRRRLCEGTDVPEKALPFAGELLRVRDGEAGWEGAAERTLRGFALSLLVPAEHYAAVSSWVDANNLRGRLVYLKVGDAYSPGLRNPGRWPPNRHQAGHTVPGFPAGGARQPVRLCLLRQPGRLPPPPQGADRERPAEGRPRPA